MVILDPAKQTRDRDEIGVALKKYLDMNRLAMQVVKPGGILLTCSCTGLISESDFLETLRRSAWQAGKHSQVFAITGAAADHPFFSHVAEGRYLKAVWMRVLPGDPIPPRPSAPELEVERFDDPTNEDPNEGDGPGDGQRPGDGHNRPRFEGPGGFRPGGPGGARQGGSGGFRPSGPRPFGSGTPFRPRPFGTSPRQDPTDSPSGDQ